MTPNSPSTQPYTDEDYFRNIENAQADPRYSERLLAWILRQHYDLYVERNGHEPPTPMPHRPAP